MIHAMRFEDDGDSHQWLAWLSTVPVASSVGPAAHPVGCDVLHFNTPTLDGPRCIEQRS